MRKADETNVRFTPEQRVSLKRLDVIDAQIAELEAVLPFARLVLRRSAPLQDVRDELQSLAKEMESAQKRMSRLLEAHVSSLALHESWDRVWMASFEVNGDGDEVERASNALTIAQDIVRRAQAELPNKQRRSNAGTPWPVARIHEALVRGWGKAYVQVRTGDAPAKAERIPPFPFKLSTDPNSSFRVIVGICYDAIRESQDNDPERAIRAYVDLINRKRNQAERDAIGSSSAQS